MSRAKSELRQAQAAAERARRLLLFPSAANLDRSLPLLEQACASMQAIARAAGDQPEALRKDLLPGLADLRFTGRRVAALLDGANRFQAGLCQALAAAAVGSYTRAGEPDRSLTPRTLSLEG